ncbi:G-protein coupled receptor moody [Ischnura elegans]|uniref:G-protein coupled receptor moody n=1 Tax=Ischnura elegans TaxID=197161 RepID=UPI001ED896FF|nr:G-protein coupled receptor moody [Ischnura elegans]
MDVTGEDALRLFFGASTLAGDEDASAEGSSLLPTPSVSPESPSMFPPSATSIPVDEYENLFVGYPSVLLDLVVVCCILFILVGIPGNLITIVALFRCKKVRNATAVFIINLSVSDLMFCCFNLPLAASTFWQRAWRHGAVLCVLFPLLRYGLVAVSLFTVLAITINRYVMIGHPRLYPKLYKRRPLALMVASTWICGFGALIPTLLGEWGRFGIDPHIGSCSILPDEHDRSPKEFLFIVAFLIPCLAIAVCYARIFYIVRKTALKSRARNNGRGAGAPTPRGAWTGERPSAPKVSLPPPTGGEETKTSSGVVAVASGNGGVMDAHSSEDSALGLSARMENGGAGDGSVAATSPTTPEVSRASHKAPPSPAAFLRPPSRPLRRRKQDGDGLEEERSLSGVADGRTTALAQPEDDLGTDDTEASCALPGTATPTSSGAASPATSYNRRRRRDRLPSAVTVNSALSHVAAVFGRGPSRGADSECGHGDGASTTGMQPGKMTAKDRRLLKMILVIFASFVICYLPITITKTFRSFDMPVLNIFGYIFIYLTTCINPIIYVVMSSEYRQAYKNLLMCRKEWDHHGGGGGGGGQPNSRQMHRLSVPRGAGGDAMAEGRMDLSASGGRSVSQRA